MRAAGFGFLLQAARRRWPVLLPLVDQVVVSAGAFLFNIALARSIPLTDYGRFALILGLVAVLQTACGSLLFYPLSVRGASADETTRRRLVLTTTLATALAAGPGSLLLGGAAALLGGPALFLPVVAVLLCGQAQEAVRRGLLCGFRHGTAIWGDAVSYLGQGVLLLVVARLAGMTLPLALWLMAATSLAGAALQAAQNGLRGTRPLPLLPLLRDYAQIGLWSLGSNLLSLLRMLGLLWLVAALTGPVGVGAYQFAINLFNMANPVIVGIGNIVPQTAARALRGGPRAALSACWPSMGAGFALIGALAGLLLLAPREVLAIVYGSKANPDMLAWPVRIVAMAALLSYMGATLCAFLQGILRGREALVADLVSTMALVLAGPPLILAWGVTGGTWALFVWLLVRAVALTVFVARTTGPSLGSNPSVPLRSPQETVA